MQESFQKTILDSVSFEGVGLHSGKHCKITILPGDVDQGIIFKRTDLDKNNLVKAIYDNVSSAKLCTTLENTFKVKVSTVEHLLAALYIRGIDNAIIEINSEEVPIMDGSAREFLNILDQIETQTLKQKRKYLKILNKIEMLDGERKISIEPNESSFQVDFQLSYKNTIIGNQRNTINFEKDDLDDVIGSRTFCLYEDIEKIKKAGLAKGGSLDNAVVVNGNHVMNKGGLRNKKEFVNHKILDLAGDFLLSGYRILGSVLCKQGGHELSNMFLRKLIEKHKSSYECFEINNTIISGKENSNSSIKIAINA